MKILEKLGCRWASQQLSGKNPPANAGDNRFDIRLRKIPQASEQLSPCARTIPALSPGATATDAHDS